MQYMITWNERQQGSPIEYENAQKRILEVFSPWKAPANFNIHSFVIRVGDWGGYMLMECDDPLEVHKFCSMLPCRPRRRRHSRGTRSDGLPRWTEKYVKPVRR
jgi:hypothetical protein